MPSRARNKIVNKDKVGQYHCISRVVRRAFLCGKDSYTGKNYDHRKKWIEEMLKYMAKHFALDLIALSIMDNHLHLQLRIRPDIVAKWSNREVARRWLWLYPQRRDKDGKPCPPDNQEIQQITKSKKRVKELRERLCSLSWFHRRLKEPIAKRANREDDTTGHFWAGRFSSIPLLTEPAAIACAMYIDLNPIRARVASTLEGSRYTSVAYRIVARQARKGQARKNDGNQASNRGGTISAGRQADAWLSPIHAGGALPASQRYAEKGYRVSDNVGLPMTLDQYLQLLDWTGRQLRKDKAGAIPPQLDNIIARLDIKSEKWVEAMKSFGAWFGVAAGDAASLEEHAGQAGHQWHHGVERSRQLFSTQDDDQ